MRSASEAPVVRLRGIKKLFGGTVAVADVDLDLYAGQVHALVGENGAGKSTLLGIAAGRVAATEGTLEIAGATFSRVSPRQARSAGICAVYQELTIVPALTTQANVFLGSEPARGGFLREGLTRTLYVQLCDEVGVHAQPDIRARRLSVADQQMLEILRAVALDARVILFDEPTASLAAGERRAFFQLVRRLREKAVAVAFVSHNLDEVLDNADVVTVFRDGRRVASKPVAEWTRRSLVDSMLGVSRDRGAAAQESAVDAMPSILEEAMLGAPTARGHQSSLVRSTRARGSASQDLVTVRALHTAKSDEGLDLTIRSGEILGIAGLVGSGRTTLLRALAGLDRSATGDIAVDGRNWKLPWTVQAARRAGISLLPEDRKGQGLALAMSASDNIALGQHGRAQRQGLVRERVLRRLTQNAMESMTFDRGRLGRAALTLSGGNQQKLLVGRWILSDHQVLLADEPTRGVDVRVRAEIMRALRRFADSGRAVVLVSSELEEVVALADRVVVLRMGQIVQTFDMDVADVTVEDLLHAAFATEEV